MRQRQRTLKFIYDTARSLALLSLFALPAVAWAVTGGGTPTAVSCGVGPSVTGSDSWGRVHVGTGAGTYYCTVRFATPKANPPVCIVIPDKGPGGTSVGVQTSHFTATFHSAVASQSFGYVCFAL